MNKKRVVSLCIVLLLVLGMAGVYVFHGNSQPEDEQFTVTTTFVNLIEREEAEVASIAFASAGDISVLLPFSDDDGSLLWLYSSGADYILNPHRTRDKARHFWSLTAVDTAHTDVSGLDLSDFGLSPPALTIDVSFYDGIRSIVRLGGLSPDLRGYFLMIDDDPHMYLISSLVAHNMSLEAGDMLDTSLPVFDFEEARYIRIMHRYSPLIVFSPGDPNLMAPHLTAPDAPPGWALLMESPMYGLTPHSLFISQSVLGPLTSLSIRELIDIHPETLAPFGFDNPFLEFEYHSAQGSVHLVFGDRFMRDDNEYIYVKFADRPHVFAVNIRMIASLMDINTISLVERFITLINIADVYSVNINSTNPDLAYHMTINHATDGSGQISPVVNDLSVSDADFRIAYRLLISLSIDATVESFPIQDEPYLTIMYNFINGSQTEVSFFERDSNFLYVSINGNDIGFVTNRLAVSEALTFLEEMLP